MSYSLQILGKYLFFEDVQMILKSVLDISNGTKVTRNAKACGSILEQSLANGTTTNELDYPQFMKEQMTSFCLLF